MSFLTMNPQNGTFGDKTLQIKINHSVEHVNLSKKMAMQRVSFCFKNMQSLIIDGLL